jgi:hypothetical protein
MSFAFWHCNLQALGAGSDDGIAPFDKMVGLSRSLEMLFLKRCNYTQAVRLSIDTATRLYAHPQAFTALDFRDGGLPNTPKVS